MARKSTDPGRHIAGWVAWASVVGLLAIMALGSYPLAQAKGWLIDGGQPTISAEQLESLQPEGNTQALIGSAGCLEPKASADQAKVAQAIKSVGGIEKGSLGIAVADLGADDLLYGDNADVAMTPASTNKIMTGLSALKVLGYDSTFATRVMWDSETKTLTLVGGGDPLLASTPETHPYRTRVKPATLSDLADQVATKLAEQGISEVTLNYDDSLFSGPSWHPDWAPDFRQWVAPITALAVDLGNAPAHPETADPSLAAAQTFADQLHQLGITASAPSASVASPELSELASVTSPSVYAMVEQLIIHSDNYVTEVLFRQTAVASGKPATFQDAAALQTELLKDFGLWSDNQVITDGSGLSDKNKLTPRNLVKALQLANSLEQVGYLLAGLPTARVSGSLAARFWDEASSAGAGRVRAKTGYLDHVSSLAGITPTKDGAIVVFAFIGNDLPLDTDPRPWFDHAAAALAGCQCAVG